MAPKRLLEVASDAQARAAKRTLRRKSTDEEVAKCIKDNFKGWTEHDTDVYQVSGITLRGQMLQDSSNRSRHRL